jgi:hypothetical protein
MMTGIGIPIIHINTLFMDASPLLGSVLNRLASVFNVLAGTFHRIAGAKRE